MADPRLSLPANRAGDFYVDSSCIDCAACRWIAPAVFGEAGGYAYVRAQPGRRDLDRAKMAVVACPVAAIGTRARHAWAAARDAFPDPVEDEVHHCGYHAAASFGAASYLIVRPGGNVLVDSPRYAGPLVRRLEALGGVRWMFLTHRDDVADHDRFAGHFGCTRIIHEHERGPRTRDAEWVLTGEGDHALDDGLTALFTPGHTRGSLCLLWRERFLFTGDHLSWDPAGRGPVAHRDVCWHDWGKQRRSVGRLAEHRFEWVLPGHGHPGRMAAEAMPAALRALAARMGGH